MTVERRLVGELGLERLLAAVGPSYGGLQAFSWAIEYPNETRGIVAAVRGLGAPPAVVLEQVAALLSADPNWNGGNCYETGDVFDTLTTLRERTIRAYGIEENLKKSYPQQAERDAEIRRIACSWAESFDANSLLALGGAMMRFNPTPKLASIKAKVLYVLSRTDEYFPPSIAPSVMAALEAADVDARYFEIDSEHGHLASGLDADKWGTILRRFCLNCRRKHEARSA